VFELLSQTRTTLPYRLLAFDYDGTAAIDGQLPTQAVCNAVTAARAAGVIAVLATGRPYESAARYAAALDLDAPVICFQGAMVRELSGEKRVLYVEPAPADAMCEVMALAEERNLELNIYGEDLMHVIDRGRPAEFYERWFGMAIRFARSYAEICDRFAAAGKSPLKGLFIGPSETNDAFRDELRARFGDRLSVVRSHDLFVEVHSLDASKGHGLRFMAEHYGIPQSETIAVGDSGNDSSMIEWAGLGVAVANALPEVFAVADEIAPAVTEDGLAHVIERHIFNNGRI
jgi:Cof subfamily protein (haloacid dehalogenase superfamily)